MKKVIFCLASAILLTLGAPLRGHVGSHPSVHDTVAGIIERMRRELSYADMRALTLARVEKFLAPQERQILGTEHISFSVNVPVRVSVIRNIKSELPFWLQERNFRPTYFRMHVASDEFDVWQREFTAGWVGLGVNSLRGGGNHYFVSVAPINDSDKLEIRDLYPGQLRLETAKADAKPYVDGDQTIKYLPAELQFQTLIRTERARADDARLVRIFQFTKHRGSNLPDEVILTWSDDPRTTQTIQWRTGPRIKAGVLAYLKKSGYKRVRPDPFKYVRAESQRIDTKFVVNDPVTHWHTVNLKGLEPNSTYVYAVGNGERDGWTELAEFTTAPAGVQPFSFAYMGDAQNGLDRWGTLVRNAFRLRPDAAFYIMAGDLVDRGAERDDWDSLFYNAKGVYDHRQLMPALGNHECQGGHPTLYLKLFNLPKNGPPAIEPERVYAFEYSNAFFVMLDSNLAPESQSQWLEEQLSKTKATWKFVTFHHPIYSSGPARDNKKLRETWAPLFDKYHVDMVLQGHDHAYLRTYPMKGEKRAASSKEGTIYVISVSGTKAYTQDKHDYTEFGMTNVATYQVMDIQISGDRMVYRAYDIDGKLRDEFVIEK